MFIGNFHGMYEHPFTAETMKTIRQKHDESLRHYIKYFCNARNAIPYIQDIEIINAFCNKVSNIKTVEEITMKKPKTVTDLLAVADVCIEASKARAQLLETGARGPQGRRKIVRSTQLPGVIARTKGTADIMASNPQSRKRRGLFDVLMTRRTGVRFTAPRGTIWKSAKLSWIGRRCQHQQHRRRRIPGELISVGQILTEMSRWGRSMLSSGPACPSPPRRSGRSSSMRSIWPSVLSQEEG
jgi:hypothetical protein